jgi:glutamate/tyrosine decarboxylase-like PLP-dependent enzyme
MTALAESGIAWSQLKSRLVDLKSTDVDWKKGRLPVYVYQYNEELMKVSQEAYMEFFTENALGAGKAFPSVKVIEDEVVAMALDVLGGAPDSAGTFTSGGSESIFLALKTARDWARAERGITAPKIVMPWSGHATATKAAEYLGMEVVRTPLDAERRSDIAALRSAIDARTIMLYGSAPSYPHGVFDRIEAMGQLALEHNLWLHVDACVGGFLAPFARELGYAVPAFDLSVPGVSSVSADMHKYGFAAKGASVMLLRDGAHKKYQQFNFSDWPRGNYATQTAQGTRAAGPIASSWAVMNTLGRQGYRDIAKVIMDTVAQLAKGVEAIDGLRVVRPHDLCMVLYESVDAALDINAVAELMTQRGWFVGRSISPVAIHVAVNPLLAPALPAYLADLAQCVAVAREQKKVGAVDHNTY